MKQFPDGLDEDGLEVAAIAQQRLYMELLPLTRALRLSTQMNSVLEDLRDRAAICDVTRKALEEAGGYAFDEIKEDARHEVIAELAEMVYLRTRELESYFHDLADAPVRKAKP